MTGTKAWMAVGDAAGNDLGNANVTLFMMLGNNHMPTGAVNTEALHEFTTQASGVLSDLYATVKTNSRGNASTIKSRKNGADGALTASITANTTGTFRDTTHSDTLASSDRFCAAFVTGSGFSSIVLSAVGAVFTADTGCTTFMGALGDSGIRGQYTTTAAAWWRFGGVLGINFDTSEAIQQQKMRTAGTFRALTTYVHTNSKTGTTTAAFRNNGASGNQALSITTTTTGRFIDTSHTDAVVSGDLVTYQLTGGTSGSLQIDSIGIQFDSGGSAFPVANGGSGNNGSTTSTTFFPPAGRSGTNTTETNTKSRVPFDMTLTKLRFYSSSNPTTGITVQTRINGSNGSLGATAPASTTGWFEDSSSTDTVVNGDLLDIAMPATSSQFMTVDQVMFTADPGGGGGGGGVGRRLILFL